MPQALGYNVVRAVALALALGLAALLGGLRARGDGGAWVTAGAG